MAIPHPLLDAPRQRVSAGYGCRMNTETDDGMIEHHFNIGMAYSSDGKLLIQPPTTSRAFN